MQLRDIDRWLGTGEFEDPPRLRAESDFALRNPGFVTTIGTAGRAHEDEMVLWNYLVGGAQTRAEHNVALTRAAPGWRAALRANPLLKIRIMGSASSASGDAARNQSVARARAVQIQRILTNVHGIPAARIVVESEGDVLPLADEMSPDNPLNMARDRRVEIFLFVPTRLVTKIDRVSVPFSGLTTNLDSRPSSGARIPDPPVPNEFSERMNPGILADGTATWAGPPDSTIGFIQLLTRDVRKGRYRSGSGKTVILDFSRCTRPFLPCRDVLSGGDSLSFPDRTGPGFGEVGTGRFMRVRVPFRDFPGSVLPLGIVDPVAGPVTLVRSEWRMAFVLMFGVRRGDAFLPLHFVRWSLASVRRFPGATPLEGPIVFRTAAGAGAPPDLSGAAFAKAMAGASCRLRARSIDNVRRRTPADECPEIPLGRPCPPLVCNAHVRRL